ncbi:hypothetical protein Agabi119p4_5265 [Agaricus bisporus var. burnettii]|uniref:Uncharacterized protein n=1 Tax=Agaricus bisporus var. burnettii TaxID=192524 RepID=A0A8H7F4U3_AGABI|nr:hypothetical protein Agabi119p4_5265 [Agaricus bisporus var. burnettii]
MILQGCQPRDASSILVAVRVPNAEFCLSRSTTRNPTSNISPSTAPFSFKFGVRVEEYGKGKIGKAQDDPLSVAAAMI